jgi:hypothetical protein
MPRPRLHPEGSTATDRKRESVKSLYQRGGKMMNVALEAEDLSAMLALRKRHGLPTDREAIAFALRLASAATLLPDNDRTTTSKKAA